MADAIAVLNAGSSRLKSSVFVARGGDLELGVRGHAGWPLLAALVIVVASGGAVVTAESSQAPTPPAPAASSNPGPSGQRMAEPEESLSQSAVAIARPF